MAEHISHRDQLIAELTTRLRPVCADWPAEHFDRMVREMVEIRLRFEGQLPLSQAYDRRSTERLIAELKSSVPLNDEEK